jgi:hypothetical protein
LVGQEIRVSASIKGIKTKRIKIWKRKYVEERFRFRSANHRAGFGDPGFGYQTGSRVRE